jgi:aminoglycoside 6'-N-acetyltransferase
MPAVCVELRRPGVEPLRLQGTSAGLPPYAVAVDLVRAESEIADPDVWVVDLSGPCAMFACDGEAIPFGSVGFRSMTRADFAEVVRWQREPHVARWWSDEAPDIDGAEKHYGPALDGTDPTRMWVVELDGRSIGFVQDYRIRDHPEYSLLTGEPDAIGFDYAIGDPSWVDRGIGTRMLWTYLRDVVRPHYPEALTFFAAPDHRNKGSLRVLEKLGFTEGLWFDEPQADGRVDTVVGCSLDVGATFGDDAH